MLVLVVATVLLGTCLAMGGGETLVTILLPEAGRPQARVSFCRQKPAGCGHQPSSSWAWGRPEPHPGVVLDAACVPGLLGTGDRCRMRDEPLFPPLAQDGGRGKGRGTREREGVRRGSGKEGAGSQAGATHWLGFEEGGAGGRGGVVPIPRARSAHTLRPSWGPARASARPEPAASEPVSERQQGEAGLTPLSSLAQPYGASDVLSQVLTPTCRGGGGRRAMVPVGWGEGSAAPGRCRSVH